MKRLAIASTALILAAVGGLGIQSMRTGRSMSQVVMRPFVSQPALQVTSARGSILPRGPMLDFLTPKPVGGPVTGQDRPLIANVATADLDGDGLPDVLACDLVKNRVVWLRQFPEGVFTETPIGDPIAAPAHVSAVDIDGDGDLDLLVASLGVLLPSNAKIGAVVILENDGRQHFTNHVIIEKVARVTDVRAGDLDGDGKLDLAVAQFGYNDGETRWMKNLGGWRFESHVLHRLSGPINVEITDVDGDGDLDIVSLVSQEWEEVYGFENDGHGNFTSHLVFGSSNEDFGSSWITVADLDKDGDPDIVYSNGDAFDYQPTRGRSWHGVQWLENTGHFNFVMHRIVDFSGSSSPQVADLDGDGDLDVIVVSAYNDWENPSAQSIIWLENNGKMQFAAHDIANSPTHLITLAVGDFNRDRKPDLVTGGLHLSPPFDRRSRLTVWMNGWPPKAH